MTNKQDDAFWFLKTPEEIKKMQDNLPPMEFPLGEKLLTALEQAKGKEKEFLDTVLLYTGHPKDVIIQLIDAALDDWVDK